MANERDERKHNPYAPPLSSLPQTSETENQPFSYIPELHILDLINSLAKDPIQVRGHLPELAHTGEIRSEPEAIKVGSGFRVFMILVGLISLTLLLLVDMRVLAISILTSAAIGLLTAARFARTRAPARRRASMTLPAGEYTWLISDGGMLITTPSAAQWAMPWSVIERLQCDAAWWECLSLHDQAPPWRMPLDAISGEDLIRFQQVVNAAQILAAARRSHPVCFAERVEWTQEMALLSGLSWSVLHEAPRVWCDIRGLVCSLPRAEVEQLPDAVVVKDLETDWAVVLPVEPGSLTR